MIYTTIVIYNTRTVADEKFEAGSMGEAARIAFEQATTGPREDQLAPGARNVSQDGEQAPDGYRRYNLGDGFGRSVGSIYVRLVSQ